MYAPATDELFVAERGQGAYFNDKRIRVSARRDLASCVIGCTIPHLGKKDHKFALLEQHSVMKEVSGVRCSGSTALDLAYVAAGRYDGMWHRTIDPWDIAAGLILVREAGGYATDTSGGKNYYDDHSVLAGNEHIHRGLGDVLKTVGKSG